MATTTITVQIIDDDSDEAEIELPARFEVFTQARAANL